MFIHAVICLAYSVGDKRFFFSFFLSFSTCGLTHRTQAKVEETPKQKSGVLDLRRSITNPSDAKQLLSKAQKLKVQPDENFFKIPCPRYALVGCKNKVSQKINGVSDDFGLVRCPVRHSEML